MSTSFFANVPKSTPKDHTKLAHQLQLMIQELQNEYEKLAFKHNFRPEETWPIYLTYVRTGIDNLAEQLNRKINDTARDSGFSKEKIIHAVIDGLRVENTCPVMQELARELEQKLPRVAALRG